MKAIIKYLVCGLVFAMFASTAGAQYYDQGAAPASVKWSYIKTPYNKMIFPREYLPQAARAMHYLDTVRLSVAHGYRVGPMRTPVVLQTRDFASNGLVMRAPTRMELIVPPPAAMAPEPWLKQLVTHESRHAVQYNLVNRNLIRFLGYIIGDQGALIGVGQFPMWGLEGDAVMAETELSTFGRGLQPSFTIEYRAMLDGNRWRGFATDKWFCGSLRDFLPDHYQWGYQVNSYAWTKYGENIWDRAGDHASKYPFLIFPAHFALRKFYDTSGGKLGRETLESLYSYWSSLPARENSTRLIATPVGSYTTYSSPVVVRGVVLAIKKDLDRPERLISADPVTGNEAVLANTGYVTSPLSVESGMAVWSEQRSSKFWGQKVNSVIRTYDLLSGKRGTVRGERQALFPVPVGEDIFYVRYDYDGSYSLCRVGMDEPLWRFPLPVSIHGLAADLAGSLYFIAVDEGGMYVGEWTSSGVRIVKPSSYATLGGLRAGDGKLYFTSTQSGRDEAHILDLKTGEETRITDSRYGSFSPAPTGGGIVATTYTGNGYMLATQSDTVPTHPVRQEAMPLNVVNPPRHHWDEVSLNMDSIVVADTVEYPVKRYRRALNAINVHSWAPASFDPDQMVTDEMQVDIMAGVTAISQDMLNTTFLTARYGWTRGGSIVQANLRYQGWVPKIEIGATLGGGDQVVYNAPRSGIAPRSRSYVNIYSRLWLPVLFDWGAHSAVLQPMVEFGYSNGIIYYGDPLPILGLDGSIHRADSPTRGLNKLITSLQFSHQARMAYRDFMPRWGYAVRASLAAEPMNDRFAPLWTGYARAIAPGPGRHHSLMLRGAWQLSGEGMFSFTQKELFPRGANYAVSAKRYHSFSADYQFPLCYPDRGIPAIIFIKRVRLNLTGDLARWRGHAANAPWREIYSFGGQLIFDTNFLRIPAVATNTVSLSVYRPSDRKGVFTGVEVSIPL